MLTDEEIRQLRILFDAEFKINRYKYGLSHKLKKPEHYILLKKLIVMLDKYELGESKYFRPVGKVRAYFMYILSNTYADGCDVFIITDLIQKYGG